MAPRIGNGLFLSQSGAGWFIRKGLRTGLGFGRACSQYRHLPAELRTDPISAPERIGRNEPCPCGSGKKFKKCCGAT
jgi:hypothetical protein